MTHAQSPRKTFAEMQRDALVEQAKERNDERRRVEEIVIPNPRSGYHLGEIVRLGDDYVAEVIRGDQVTWTTVVSGARSSFHHCTHELAVLHLIAQRYDPDPNSNIHAAFYAGRVLGIPGEDA